MPDDHTKTHSIVPATIRGDNPPHNHSRQAEKLKEQIITLRVVSGILAALALVIGIIGPSHVSIPIAIASFLVALCVLWQADKKVDLVNSYEQRCELDAYNTEFTCPLADRSTIRATVHFQIPRSLNNTHPAAYGEPQPPSYFVEQLNRVTEAKLIAFTQEFTDPPSRFQIEEYLNRALVQFQDENYVPVFRVSVTIAIHVHPDKPKGVNV